MRLVRRLEWLTFMPTPTPLPQMAQRRAMALTLPIGVADAGGSLSATLFDHPSILAEKAGRRKGVRGMPVPRTRAGKGPAVNGGAAYGPRGKYGISYPAILRKPPADKLRGAAPRGRCAP